MMHLSDRVADGSLMEDDFLMIEAGYAADGRQKQRSRLMAAS